MKLGGDNVLIIFILFLELSRMCKKEKLPFLEHSNINPRAYLNKRRIYLSQNDSEKLGKNFVDFIVNHYA